MHSEQTKSLQPQNINVLGLKSADIVDVYQSNFESEMSRISQLIQNYPYIAMDTEFPGVFQSSTFRFESEERREMEYAVIRQSVLQTNLIQLGISISDEKGNVPEGVSTWQFNFRFDKDGSDRIQPESQSLLVTAGIKFQKLKREGIDGRVFAETLMGSDLVCNDSVVWVQFHGGFDQLYLSKYLLGNKLPQRRAQYMQCAKVLFPNYYDIKTILQNEEVVEVVYQTVRNSVSEKTNLMYMGLAKLADSLRVERIGPQHQAGSDSLLTLRVFFQLQEVIKNYNRWNKVENLINELCTEWRFNNGTASSTSRTDQSGRTSTSISNGMGNTNSSSTILGSHILSNQGLVPSPSQYIQGGGGSSSQSNPNVKQGSLFPNSGINQFWDMTPDLMYPQPSNTEIFNANYLYNGMNSNDYFAFYPSINQQQPQPPHTYYGAFSSADDYTPNPSSMNLNSTNSAFNSRRR